MNGTRLEAGVKMQLVEDDEDEHDCLEATDKLIAQGINAGDINKLQDAGIYTMMQTKKIIYARAYTYEHHYNLLLGLAARMSDEPFRLLIIDSSALFRVDFCGRVELAERQRQSVVKITTGSQTLDELLGGDIETSSITEAFREFRRSYIQPAILPPIFTARSGESQAAHKHCVSKQMPRSMQGGNGSLSMHGGNEKVAFSDTEGTFRPDRIVTIAKRFCLDSGAVLDNIIYGCAYIYEHQNYLLLGLAAKMFAEPFMLGISDSAIALFRVDFSRGGELSTCDQSLAPMLSRIIKIAEEFNVNVCMHDEVIAQGINAWDIKKLQDAGIYTCNGLVMQASKRQSVVKIITGNQTLDELLGGGIETSSITEAFREFRWSDIQLAILPPIFTARSGGNQVVHTHCVSTQMPCCMQQRLAQMLSRIIKIPEGFNSNVCMEEEVDETEAVENVLIQAAIALSDDKQRDDLFDLEFAMKKLRWITTRLSRRMELRGRRKLAIRSYLHQLEKVRLSGRMASFPLVRVREVGIKVRIQVPIFIRHVREYSVIFRPSTMSWHVIHLRLPHSSASLSHSIQPNILFTEEDPNHKSFLGINVLDPEWIQVGDETPYSLSPEVVGVVGRWLIMVPGTEGGMAYDRYNLALAPKIIPQVPIDFLTMKVQIFPVGHYLFMMTNTNEAMFTALSTESWQWVTPFPLKPQSLRFNMVGVYTNKLIIVGFSQTSESFPVWAVEMVNGLPSEAEENFSLLKSIPLPDIADAVWKWDQSMRMCQEYIFFSCFNRNVINVIYYNLKTGATETSMVESVGVVKPWHATCISAAVGSFYV